MSPPALRTKAFNAILFFYQQVLGQPLGNVKALRASRPVHERHAPTVAETQRFLQTVRNQGGYPTNLIARMLYGWGLRVSEPLNLRIKDIELERGRLCIRGIRLHGFLVLKTLSHNIGVTYAHSRLMK